MGSGQWTLFSARRLAAFDRARVEVRNEADRAEQTQKVEAILSACCFELKQNAPKNEREVMNLACLVGRKSPAEFEAGIFEAARLFDNHFAFNYNGPWAPHNFVQVDLKL